MSDPIITPALIKQHGLTPEEFERIKGILEREPNYTELGIFSVMWSEHCSYKNTRPLLKTFPTKSPKILVGAGEENAGIIDIGDGLAIALQDPGVPQSSQRCRTRFRARLPASAASSAIFSPWAPAPSARSIPSASAPSPETAERGSAECGIEPTPRATK